MLSGTLVLKGTIFFSCRDMGCHIDGFIAVVAHTHILQEGPVTGRAADVITASNTAADVALRLVRLGKKVMLCTQFEEFIYCFVSVCACVRTRVRACMCVCG